MTIERKTLALENPVSIKKEFLFGKKHHSTASRRFQVLTNSWASYTGKNFIEWFSDKELKNKIKSKTTQTVAPAIVKAINDSINNATLVKNAISLTDNTLLNDDEKKSFINAIDLRHPLIERIINIEYVPHNVLLDEDILGNVIFSINTSGATKLLASP